MSTLLNLARNRAILVWVVLMGATMTSWALGTDHRLGDHRTASIIIMLVALTKARLVGLYFMELRTAPTALRLIFETYCALVVAAVIATCLMT